MKTVEIPDEMHDAISEIIKENPELGYESVDEFVREAIRKHYLSW
jgi:Arc/MetJ-type ribon-helix-helix transcriptional regulator